MKDKKISVLWTIKQETFDSLHTIAGRNVGPWLDEVVPDVIEAYLKAQSMHRQVMQEQIEAMFDKRLGVG